VVEWLIAIDDWWVLKEIDFNSGASGAPFLSKFGNLSIREILVVTSAYARPYRLWGRGRGVPRQPEGGGYCHLFLAGNRAVLLGNRRFSWREIAWPLSLLKKRVSLKSLILFSKTIVRQYCSFKLQKKTSNICKWKEEVQKNTGKRRKVQVTKAAFKGLHRFVFFTTESLPCSETQPSKWSF